VEDFFFATAALGAVTEAFLATCSTVAWAEWMAKKMLEEDADAGQCLDCPSPDARSHDSLTRSDGCVVELRTSMPAF
jgi:hypothetical protein